MRRVFLFTSLLLISSAMGAHSDETEGSQTNPKLLADSIVVTANRQPTPRREIGSAVTVIRPDQTGTGQAQSVTELLRTVPGVDIARSGGEGKTTSVFLRGANSHHTLVIIDGVEMNDPSTANGAFDFANLDANHIDRIEILRGSQSVLYGSDAIGGVIQLFTKRGESDHESLEISADAGSYSSFNETIRYSGRQDHLDFSLMLGRRDSDGFTAISSDFGTIEPDGFGSTEISGQIGVDLSQGYHLSLAGRSMDATTDIDQGGGTFDDPNYMSETTTRSFKLGLRRMTDHQRWTPSIDLSFLDQDYLTTDMIDPDHPLDSSNYHSDGTRLKISTQQSYQFSELLGLTAGAELEEEKYSSERFTDGSSGPAGDTVSEKSARTTSLYLLNQLALDNQLFLTLGARIDHHDQFGDEETWRVTSAYLIEQIDLKLRSSIGIGFKAPTLFQLFHPSWGNPELKPETSLTWEVGFDKSFGLTGLSLSGTYFDHQYENLVGFDPDTYASVNIDEAKSSGLEVEAAFNSSNQAVRLSFNHTKTKNITQEAPILRRPEDKASLSFSQTVTSQLNLTTNLLYVGDRTDMNFIDYPYQEVLLENYMLLDLGLKYRPIPALEIKGLIKNLFDKEYIEVFTYSTSGRAFNLGASLILN